MRPWIKDDAARTADLDFSTNLDIVYDQTMHFVATHASGTKAP